MRGSDLCQRSILELLFRIAVAWLDVVVDRRCVGLHEPPNFMRLNQNIR